MKTFIGFLESKLKPPFPIEFEVKSFFTTYWYDFVTFVSSYLEQESRELADRHNYYLYHLPTLALIPRIDRYIVFVKKQTYENMYLGYNTAYVFASIRKHYYVVPHIPDNMLVHLVKQNINPAVLCEVLYILPILSSIPCTTLINTIPMIKDHLIIRAQSYLVSSEIALSMLGYILLKLLGKTVPDTYEEVFNEMKNIIAKILADKNFKINEKQLHVKYLGFPVDIYILEITEHNYRSHGM